MNIKVLEGDTVLGIAQVYALDPPMGVAMAKFAPTTDFDPERHANMIDGNYGEDRSDILCAEMADGSSLKSKAISIQAWPTLGECEVHFLGVYEPHFDELFAERPDYRAYWGNSENSK